MTPSVCAVIASGGTGSRFGNPGGKQLVNLAGKPMMTWSLLAFDRSAQVGHIVVVCPAERREEVRAVAIEPYALHTPVSFADAGETRQDSTRAAVAAVPEGFAFVAIHDGARPLITTEAIDAAIETLLEASDVDGVVCGQPAVDTLKLVAQTPACGRQGCVLVESTPPRSNYWTAQTPQIFPVELMRRAFAEAESAGFVGTDDASLVEGAGGRVLCVACARDNPKVTVPEDLRYVEAILQGRLLDENEGRA